MRAKVSNGKMAEVYANMNEFYVETGSNLSVEEVGQELERKEVEIPPLKIRNLFPTIKKLLA